MDPTGGTGLGLLLEAGDFITRRNQQKRLQQMQIEGQKEMAKYNSELAYEMWEKTNYAAQRRQMEKAGLSVGLMYGGQGGGKGGQMAMPAGNVSGQQPQGIHGMGIQAGMQASMLQAQIDNIKANTEKTKADTAKTAGVDTEETQNRIAKLAAETNNEVMKGIIMNYEKAMAETQSRVQNETQDAAIRTINAQAEKLISEAKSAEAKGTVDAATVNNTITQIQQANIEQQLRIATQKQGLEIGEAQLQKIATDIVNIKTNTVATKEGIRQKDDQITVQQKEALIKQLQQEFNTSDAAKLKQWTSLITDIVNLQ